MFGNIVDKNESENPESEELLAVIDLIEKWDLPLSNANIQNQVRKLSSKDLDLLILFLKSNSKIDEIENDDLIEFIQNLKLDNIWDKIISGIKNLELPEEKSKTYDLITVLNIGDLENLKTYIMWSYEENDPEIKSLIEFINSQLYFKAKELFSGKVNDIMWKAW